ncbi:MAG: polysaccharide pyruvyl transferase family protein, partial [Acidimicrobiia bacterium]
MDLIEPRVAHWGTFDVDNYGDHLFRPVAEHELGRRLPGLTLDAFSPFGWLHPTSLDATPAVSPLGLPSALRRRAFAVSYDLVLVGGGELIHDNDPLLAAVYGVGGAQLAELAPSRFFVEGLGPDLERDCPVVWHALGVPTDPDPALRQRVRDALAGRALVSVRDRFSAARLVQAGVTAEIEVVPDPAVLLERVLPAATLARRLEGLRMRGCYPQGPAMVVQGCDLLLPHADAMADALGAWLGGAGWRDVVLAVTGRCRGDDAFADALAARLGGRAGLWR